MTNCDCIQLYSSDVDINQVSWFYPSFSSWEMELNQKTDTNRQVTETLTMGYDLKQEMLQYVTNAPEGPLSWPWSLAVTLNTAKELWPWA